jgi:hypothetical protein
MLKRFSYEQNCALQVRTEICHQRRHLKVGGAVLSPVGNTHRECVDSINDPSQLL